MDINKFHSPYLTPIHIKHGHEIYRSTQVSSEILKQKFKNMKKLFNVMMRIKTDYFLFNFRALAFMAFYKYDF